MASSRYSHYGPSSSSSSSHSEKKKHHHAEDRQQDQQQDQLSDDALVTSWLYGKAPQTRYSYDRRFKEFRQHCANRHIKIREVRLHNVQSFLSKVERRGVMVRPVAAILKVGPFVCVACFFSPFDAHNTTQSFYKWACQAQHILRNPLELLRLGRQPPPAVERKLTKEEMKKLIKTAKTFTRKGRAHYFITALGCYSGLR
jgi:site-specific recombinase XerD